ncbi:MAG TPA: cellulase family glycosylhydrolase [Telluria sp.]|nr:cellulase family glycosylhydrolase [Telluria sp.]
MTTTFAKLCALSLCLLASCAQAAAPNPPVALLHAAGTKWVKADGSQVSLKGVNLGNWLINEFWMMGQGSAGIDDECKLEAVFDQRFGYAERERLMKLHRDNWITTRDWDLMPKFGLNAVRVPFIYSVVEDEKNPRHLRPDAWRYLDRAIDEAEKRGMYVILDLHGAVGSQGREHHSGCAGKNLYWSTPEYQQRTVWLWQQIAARYKDRAAVAGYSLLNEPWGTTAPELAVAIKTLYAAVRAVDRNHVIILPGHDKGGIDAYGKPSEQGMVNVAFEIHPYPGHFGWSKPGMPVHRDWLRCGPTGTAGVCEWSARIARLDTPLFIGEFQPWAELGNELGGQITRASYDTYAAQGWAATAWAWKLVSNKGGQGAGTWGMVTNAPGATVPALDFGKAPLAEIEALFTSFGSLPYEPQEGALRWMNSSVAPDPFK